MVIGIILKELNHNINKILAIDIKMDNFYYYSVLLTILLQSFAYLPLIAQVYESKDTTNLPYSTLLMLLTAAFILLIVAMYRGYYTHVFVFLVYFGSIGYLINMKINNKDTN